MSNKAIYINQFKEIAACEFSTNNDGLMFKSSLNCLNKYDYIYDIKENSINEIVKIFENEKCVRLEIEKNNINLTELNNVLKIINRLGADKRIDVVVFSEMGKKFGNEKMEYVYDNSQKNLLINFYNALKAINKNSQILFNEVHRFLNVEVEKIAKFWTLEQVLRTNCILNDIIEDIKQMGLTPFETVMFVHRFIMENFKFKNNYDCLEASRVLPAVLAEKNYNIVCGGYASLLKAILDGLDIKDIDCRIVSGLTYVKTKGLINGHTCNFIKIFDNEYKIAGAYIDDSCYNLVTGLDENHSFYWRTCLMDVESRNSILNPMFFYPRSDISRFGDVICHSLNIKESNGIRKILISEDQQDLTENNKKVVCQVFGSTYKSKSNHIVSASEVVNANKNIIDCSFANDNDVMGEFSKSKGFCVGSENANKNIVDCSSIIYADDKIKAICKIKEKYKKCFNSELSYTERFKKIQTKYFGDEQIQNNGGGIER